MTTFSFIGHFYKFMLKYITKQRYLVLVTTEMHCFFDLCLYSWESGLQRLCSWKQESLSIRKFFNFMF